MSGFILIDKTSGPTSHDLVDRVRRTTGERRVGHAGTLDPFARGLLIVGVGREATREFSKFVGLDKRYRAILRLGAKSTTDDRMGTIRHCEEAEGRRGNLPGDCFASLAKTDIEKALRKFIGKIEQVPPMYSAKKNNGRKLYELARAGETIERKPSSVEIYSLLITHCAFPFLSLDIHCSSGTYIRALARDLGEELGCGAYVEELERTDIGPFALKEAAKIDEIAENGWQKYLKPITETLARCQPTTGVLG